MFPLYAEHEILIGGERKFSWGEEGDNCAQSAHEIFGDTSPLIEVQTGLLVAIGSAATVRNGGFLLF